MLIVLRRGVFFGHTHEDQFMIYYANNATSISADAAQSVGWVRAPPLGFSLMLILLPDWTESHALD